MVRVAQVVECTEAEGPGRRFAVWFQGCPLRCQGCCNPEMLPLEGGQLTPIDELVLHIKRSQKTNNVEGVSFLGGEPFAHSEGVSALASACQNLGLSVMIYSGYTLQELRNSSDPLVGEILKHTDILVDGPYVRELPESQRRWVGSSNQVVHFLSARYSPNDPCWVKRNSIEIRLRDGELTVNGFPAANAVELWRRPKVIAST